MAWQILHFFVIPIPFVIPMGSSPCLGSSTCKCSCVTEGEWCLVRAADSWMCSEIIESKASSSQHGYKAPASQKAAEERNKEATSSFGEHHLGVWSFPDTPEHAQRIRAGLPPSQIYYWRRRLLGSLQGFWFSSPPCSCRITQRCKLHKSAVMAGRWKRK